MSESGIELKPLGEAAGGKNITVPGGETIIGRGQFLQVADKRVSRKHGLLEVKNGKVFLTPTHMNPCFFRTSGSSDQVTLPKDVPHPLENGDHFGLLPDSLFFEVVISSPAKSNGNLNSEESKPTEECTIKKKTSSEKVHEGKKEESGTKSSVAEEKSDASPVKQPKPSSTKAPEIPKPAPAPASSTTSPEKKRTLPNWLVAAADSAPPAGVIKKKKPAPKPVTPSKAKVSSDYASEEEIAPKQKTPKKGKAVEESPKKRAETKPILSGSEEDESDEPRKNGKNKGKSKRSETPSEDEMSEEEYKPKAKGRGRQKVESPSEEEESSEEEYKPRGKRRAPSKRNRSPSDDDSDDEYSPRAKAKKKSKARATRATPKRKQPARRKKYNESEDSEEDSDSSPRKRPSRLAKTKRASYVDDFVVDDFSEESEEIPVKTAKEDQDSDFVAEEDDSGSDWATDRRPSQKSPGKRSRGRPQAPRRASRNTRRKQSDSEEEESESEEEYTPRPSKRRQPAKPESNKKTKHRKPCPFGKKCYRKNPAHFQDVAHPGDDSYDEGSEDEEEESGSGSEVEDKPECEHGTECYRKNAEHLRKFKHTKKPQKKVVEKREKGVVEKREKDKKSVLAGDSDDNGDPNTYDYDDSFISKTLPSGSEASSPEVAGDDDISDDEEENVKDLVKEAKGFLKNKKLGKPLSTK